MRYVENEGALFRTESPMNEMPAEVWSPSQRKFVPYQGEVPKPQGWGVEISEQEAQEMMGGEQKADGAKPEQEAV